VLLAGFIAGVGFAVARAGGTGTARSAVHAATILVARCHDRRREGRAERPLSGRRSGQGLRPSPP
jgi:hypothetical protein